MRPGGRADHPIELLSASIDRELRPAEEAALEAHLEGCADCRGLLVDFRRLDETIGSEPPPPVPAGLEARILAGLSSRAAVPSRPLWKQAMPVAAAASLVMAIALWYGRPDRLPQLSAHGPGASNTPPATAALQADLPSSGETPPAALAPAPGARVVPEVASAPSAAPEPAPSRPALSRRQTEGAPGAPPAPKEADSEAAAREAGAVADHEAAAKDGGDAAGSWKVEAPAGAAREEARFDAAQEIPERDALFEAAAIEQKRAAAPVAGVAPQGTAAGTPARTTLDARPVGLFAPPYIVTLETGSRMQVNRGAYLCTVPIEESDGKVVTAALDEILGKGAEAAPRSMARASAGARVVTATPQARQSILRLVREIYRPVIETRCGPLPE